MHIKIFVLCVMSSFFIFVTAGCDRTENKMELNLSNTEVVKTVSQEFEDMPVRIAVGGMITPKEGFAYYKRLLDYIGEKLSRTVEFIDREDYAEINSMLKRQLIDVAFVCGGPYVDGHDEFGMELLAAPHAYGGTVYYSYIIVHKDSPVVSLEDLRDRSFAFTDPLSNTGSLVPTYMLAQINETPDSFFRSYDYTYAHDKSIKAVAEGFVDGAAVDSLIWEYTNHMTPEYTSLTRIIKKSPPYGIPPVVVRPGIDDELKEKLREIILNLHNDGEGREVLKGMMVDKFVPVDDSAYDSIRDMKKWLAKQRDKKA